MRWIFLLCALTISLQAQNVDYQLFNPNHISIWFANNGDVAHNPQTNDVGLEFPSGSGKHLVFESGVIWGCTVAGQLRGGGSAYKHALQLGTINSKGDPSNPEDPRFRIYKINKSFAHDTIKDYREWPCSDGAPCDPITHRPIFYGDEQMWWVSNDLDPALTSYLYGTPPIGVEVHSLVWSQPDDDWMNDIIFVKNTFINKNKVDRYDNMYLGLWIDFDIGDANDDLIGCDTLRQLSFGYNATQHDSVYQTPPTCGYMFLQTPLVKGSSNDYGYFNNEWRSGFKNCSLRAHSLIMITQSTYDPDPSPGSIEIYNNLQGLLWNGQPMVNPQTGEQTRFAYSGNPMSNKGWIDGKFPPLGDRRSLLSCGPFTMAPGDTQEVVYAILAAQGIDRIQSVMKLQYLADRLRSILPVKVNDVQQIPDRIFIQNYPNPFSSMTGTTISFRRPSQLNGDSKNVVIEIYDALGRRVRSWNINEQRNNMHQIFWDGKDENENTLPAGVYFMRMKSSNNFQSQKLLFIRSSYWY